ncbi:AmmeMemoRadiSam system protein A [uncultured Megasphaera sp.]|uniref:AmmeMemoRadiSam system protein A n=1 Tax=uncultured Megasphaera sp. TaxID=165188 RepID=UPI0025D71C7E|nr:AmmeMemoRadiSam system protein A [uncultured Megasphaera sp.]
MEHVCAAAGFFPHPPIMLPEIGGPELSKMTATIEAVEAAAALVVNQKPDTLVILSPHNLVFPDGAAILAAPRLYGNLGAFGYPELAMDVRTDMDLVEEIVNRACQQTDIYRLDAAWSDRFGHPLTVDQGTFVPLYYLRKAGFAGPVVIMAPRFDDCDSMTLLGDIVVKAAAALGRRIAVIASGDLSHRLLPGSPNGYTPNGAVFDKLVMEALLRQNLDGLRELSRSFIDEIATCGLPSVYFLFGVLRHFRPVMPVYAYEAPFGVGYGVALYLPEGQEDQVEKRAPSDIRVRLARESITYYLQHHALMAVPKDLPDDLQDPAGTFVSLHKGSRLRGCIGTFLPMHLNTASEIIHNAVSAATRDPRFSPVSLDEMKDIDISVDVLGEPEAIASPSELNPKKYGVIVMSHARTGLLLPDLEGIDTAEQQISIAKEKAGIPPQIQPDLYRFTVSRYK